MAMNNVVMNNVVMNNVVMTKVPTKPQFLVRPNCFFSAEPKQGLVRLRCVSKSFHAPITAHPNQTKVLVKRREEEGTATIFSILKYPFTADDDVVEESCLRPPFHHSITHGHSHGIVCCSSTQNDLFLYNPTTRELRKLPPSILLFPKIRSPQGVASSTSGVGFGYDSESGDLKVVRVVEFYTHTQLTSRPPRAEVYDLGKGRWREIKTPIPAIPMHLSGFDMFYQGRYYFWATSFDFPPVILWFDFTKEVFGVVSMPEGLPYNKLHTALAVLNESIVLFNYPGLGNEKSFHLWKMVKDDDDDQEVSWTKLSAFGPLVGVDYPLLFVSPDELLMVDNEGYLTLCNIFNTQHLKRLPFKGKFASFQASLLDTTDDIVKLG